MNYDVIVVGAGLAGLTASYKLQKSGKRVLLLEKEDFLGGRTSSWNDNGMDVEAGFHRHIGYYKALPKLLKEVGVKLNDIVTWEKEIEIIVDKYNSIILGIDPLLHPIKFLKGLIGNKKNLTFKDKLSLTKLFMIGFKDYFFHPYYLDKYSILEYTKKLNITDNVIKYIVNVLSTGIFFLPSDKYSAKMFFGLFSFALFRIHKIRIGAYNGGMSDVIAKPIANAFIKMGGVIKKNTIVKELVIVDNCVVGVKTSLETFNTNNVVLATDIGNAQKIAKNNQVLKEIIDIPTTSAITIQIELKKRTMQIDRATFAPFTVNTSFTEESNTTFKNSKGRLSIILSDPDSYMKMSDSSIFDMVVLDLKKIGIEIINDVICYRVIRHENKFYNFGPGNDSKRANNITNINGLFLAGDYTKNKFYSTMEGAVLSGYNVYHIIMNDK